MNSCGRHLEETRLDPDAAEVWACEQRYWALYERGDPGCMALYAADFIGWPSVAALPQTRTAMGDGLVPPAAGAAAPPLELVGIAVDGPVAVVHLARGSARRLADGRELPPSKVMHTWIRRGDSWLLLGGIGGYPAP